MGFFKSAAIAAASVVLFSLVACSSITMPKAELARHEDQNRNIPAIDNMIVSLKAEYINKCYGPVVHKEPPTTKCQTDLFQQLERRYHSNYTQAQVNFASDDMFFKDVNEKLSKMMKTDPEVKAAIRQASFRSQDEVFAYYKSKYSFAN